MVFIIPMEMVESRYGSALLNERSLDSSLLRLISILRQWIEALAYIHEKGFVYVDIKPDNAVVDKDGHVLVIDFGSVVEVDETDDSPIEIVVTDGYPDPDITTQIVRSITPEKLRASVKRSILTPLKDHFALGQSVMELLDIVSKEHPHDFPQRPLFQSVYLLATRLLNGKNEEKVRTGSRHRLKEVYRGLLRTDYDPIQGNGCRKSQYRIIFYAHIRQRATVAKATRIGQFLQNRKRKNTCSTTRIQNRFSKFQVKQPDCLMGNGFRCEILARALSTISFYRRSRQESKNV